MSNLLGVLHGAEETFPPALLAEVNGHNAGLHAESILVSGVEALDRSPYRGLVDRISDRIGYFASLIQQQRLLGVPVYPDPLWAQVDRVGLAQMALQAGVQPLPTQLLPHQAHPPGVEGDDFANLAYPVPWEQYLQRLDLPAQILQAKLGPCASRSFESLSELWQLYGSTRDRLHVIVPDFGQAPRILVIHAGAHLEVLLYEPLQRSLAAAPAALTEPARAATLKFAKRQPVFMCALEWVWHQGRLWLSDLHRCPNLDWWSLGEEAFSRVVAGMAQELIRRTQKR
jgi:hypothetical protein